MRLLFNPRLVTNLCLATGLALASWLFASQASVAAELLVSGGFETPVGFDIPGWELEKSFTGSSDPVNSANVTAGEDKRLFFTPFVSTPISAEDGNFDQLKPDDIDGNDFLEWQRANSPNLGDAVDLNNWKNGFGRATRFTNAALTQIASATAGETYTLNGTSTFEDNYSGQVATLDADGPFGAIPSPTTNSFIMEFLDAGGAVIGSATRDLIDEQLTLGFPGTPLPHTPLVAQAPAGTANVRITAEARDMAWNGVAAEGNNQSAFYNDFSLSAASDPGTEILTNGDLNADPPDALDFWNLVTDPSDEERIFRTWIAPWANHTPSGTRGVWLSAFFGGSSIRVTDPVDGSISQTVTAAAGATYTFSGWTKFEGNYAGGLDMIEDLGDADILFSGMASPTTTEIELEFLDGSGALISSTVIDVRVDREAQLGCAGTIACANSNTWLLHTLEAVAPPGTVEARLTGRLVDGVDAGFGQQSAFFDDFSLDGPAAFAAISLVPEPTSIVSLACGMALLVMRRNRRQSLHETALLSRPSDA